MDNKHYHITIVEDDGLLRATLVNFFKKQGFVVSDFACAEGVNEFIRNGDTDVVLCDIVLPDKSGLELMAELSDLTNLGKIFISGKTETEDRISGLSLGVDDYICKPFNETELLLRTKALINRLESQSASNKELSSEVQVLEFTLNVETRTLSYKGQSSQLGPNEFELLNILLSNQGKICSRDKICSQLSDGERYLNGRGLDILITRVRKKMTTLKADTNGIVTYRAKGYMLPQN